MMSEYKQCTAVCLGHGYMPLQGQLAHSPMKIQSPQLYTEMNVQPNAGHPPLWHVEFNLKWSEQ